MIAEIIIIGGGVIGSSIAYHLQLASPRRRTIVMERDPTYLNASSNLAMGGVRQQFGSAPNIRMAQYSVNFYRNCDSLLKANGLSHRVQFQQRGYLFLVNEKRRPDFEKRYAVQKTLGANVRLLDVSDIRLLVPGIALDDISYGILGPEDGYLDPKAVLRGMRDLAARAGAEYVVADVTAVHVDARRVVGVEIDHLQNVACSTVINAAGPHAATIAAAAGLTIPVAAVKQQLFRCELDADQEYRLPVILDPGGVHWRYEHPSIADGRPQLIVACTKWDERPGIDFSTDEGRWWNELRPQLVRRMPHYANATLRNSWAGLYELTPDHNPVLGESAALKGLLFANGFSGHGLMLAPAIGAVIASLVDSGEWRFGAEIFEVDRFSRNVFIRDEATL